MTSYETKTPIALYFYRLGNIGGGAERMTCLLANALQERGFKIHLFTWDECDAECFYPLNPMITWHKIGWKGGLVGKIQRTRKLANLLKQTNIKALVGMVMSGDKTIYAAARMAGVKLIAAERNAPSMYRYRYNKLQRWTMLGMLHLVDQIVIQLPEYTSGYPSSLHKKISTISNPVEPTEKTAFIDRPDKNGKYTLLAVSRLDILQKKLDTLIGAFARIAPSHPDWNLKIIGDGPDKTKLEQLTKMRGIYRRVTFTQTMANIEDAYMNANLFAIPSLWEGFPNALAEAMSHGLPAVGFSQASGVSELISKAEGWLAPGLADETSLAHTLSIAMSDPIDRGKRSETAISAMSEYDPAKQYDKWAKLLTRIAA